MIEDSLGIWAAELHLTCARKVPSCLARGERVRDRSRWPGDSWREEGSGGAGTAGSCSRGGGAEGRRCVAAVRLVGAQACVSACAAAKLASAAAPSVSAAAFAEGRDGGGAPSAPVEAAEAGV